MGQPAARIGDMCAHGGALVLGCPTVLIGGMPAARIGDMHVCPMLTPGVPPIPHVGGPVLKGSAGVLIGGMPAARLGDLALCVGPPDTIALGCMTVLIGETMAGGGGGGGAGAGAPASVAAQASAASALTDNLEASTKDEHWVNFEFVDKDDQNMIFRVNKCPGLEAQERMNRTEFTCEKVEKVYLSTYAEMYDPRIKVKALTDSLPEKD